MSFFEHCLREYLNKTAPRVMAVLEPLRVVIEDEGPGERAICAQNNPEDETAGTRSVPLSRELWIEREDFMVEPVPGFRRLYLGGTARLRYAGEITCRKAALDTTGSVTELRCTWAPGDQSPPARGERRAILHWVSAAHAVKAEVRLFDSLFTRGDPLAGATGDSWLREVNAESRRVLRECAVEPSLASRPAGFRCQFERHGYFCVDTDSGPGGLVFNRIVPLKDRWDRAKRDPSQRGRSG
jgi:glutaminyl-tRNA synthetase